MNEELKEQSENKPWLFKKGQSGNPNGRPKGTFSLKTFAKKYLEEMNDEEKIEFMEGLPKEVIWKMSEGNPETKTESKVELTLPAPILGGISNEIHSNNSIEEDIGTQKTP